VRLFVAIELTETWREAAVATRHALEDALDAHAARALRWVDPELLHLTLRFLGEYPDDEVGRLRSALAAEVRDVDLELTLSGAGTFGPPARTSTVWLGLDGNLEGLAALVAAVERAVVDAGAGPDDRPFAAHVTIARVRERAGGSERRAVARAVAEIEAPRVTLRARQVALVRSFLGNGAPRYEVLARYPDGSLADREQG
jgi:2'-5' RNA ligase